MSCPDEIYFKECARPCFQNGDNSQEQNNILEEDCRHLSKKLKWHERMRANPTAVHDGDYNINTSTTPLNCSAGQPINCTAASSSCTDAQIADYDIYQAFCGNPNSTSGGIRGDLSRSQLIISCPVSCDESVTVDISWQEQALGKETAGTDSVSRQLMINTRISQ